MHVALINSNRMKPPIAPLALDYLAEALAAAGHEVSILDLSWAGDPDDAITAFFASMDHGLVGVTLRNTDDCAFTSRQSFLAEFRALVGTIRSNTECPVVAGGVGFSVMPERILEYSGVDLGVWGDGEFALVELVGKMENGKEWRDVPGLIWQRDGQWQRNPLAMADLGDLPTMSRRWLDNERYYREGGQAGFETKRGCPRDCIYCADPVAKGRRTRVRPPAAVVDELENLLRQSIDHLHTCDSEFNIPAQHATEVCQEIVDRSLGGRLHWYAYCAPHPFSLELAQLMRRAGCVGINFGTDHGDDTMLRRLHRCFTPDDILHATRCCQEASIPVMLDLLFGSPGETEESMVRTIDLMRRAQPDQVGIALGVRIYPGTELAAMMERGELDGGLVGGDGLLEPLFFLEPAVASTASALLDDMIGDDPRFFFFDPDRPERNYNYNANQRLVEAIAKGQRGAYWDILRRTPR
jgi:radical SAM superfamily enzyme YgiQ (UPF0313 family)